MRVETPKGWDVGRGCPPLCMGRGLERGLAVAFPRKYFSIFDIKC